MIEMTKITKTKKEKIEIEGTLDQIEEIAMLMALTETLKFLNDHGVFDGKDE